MQQKQLLFGKSLLAPWGITEILRSGMDDWVDCTHAWKGGMNPAGTWTVLCTFTREMAIAFQAGRRALPHFWGCTPVPPCWEGFWSHAQTQLELVGPWPIKDPCHDPEILYVWEHQTIGQGHPTTCFLWPMSKECFSNGWKNGGKGWEVEGKIKREGTRIYLWLIHADVWQKPTQHCKASILQLSITTLS